jgi:hypothetical protein
MSDFEKLKNMSYQEIHKKCYISPKIIKLIINKNFEKVGNRSKVLGFISIFERELKLDLSELKQEVNEYFSQETQESAFEVEEIQKRADESKVGTYIGVLFLILLLGGGYIFMTKDGSKRDSSESVIAKDNEKGLKSSEKSVKDSDNTPKNVVKSQDLAVKEVNKSHKISEVKEVENSGIKEINESAKTAKKEENVTKKEDIKVAVKESNATFENNSTLNEDIEAVAPKITIVPKTKLWVGIIYLDNFKRKNYLTSKPIELNTSREQLIVMGHGLFKIDKDGVIEDFNDRKKQRFIYRLGTLEKIDRKTFKEYNRGKDW